MIRRGSIVLLGLLAGGCGLRGSAPSPKVPGVLSAVTVQGRAGAVRVTFAANTDNAARPIAAFDVLRRVEIPGAGVRTFFERVGSVAPARGHGTQGYVFVDHPPGANAIYHYRVRVRSGSEMPADDVRYGGPDETIRWADPPDAPTDLQAVPLHLGARLHWNPVPDAMGYRVYSVDSAGNASLEPASRGTLSSTTWTAFALEDGRTVRYVVRSVRAEPLEPVPVPSTTPTADADTRPSGGEVSDAAAEGIVVPRADVGGALRKAAGQIIGEGALPGIESKDSEIVAVTPGMTTAPAAPHQLKLAQIEGGVSLSWRPSTGEEVIGYHVERREVVGGKPVDIFQRLTAEPVPSVGYKDLTAAVGKSYEYQVRAIDASGTEGKPSESKTIALSRK